ncbi:hypothetical protein D9M72_603240 [compost metagenome]
MVDVFNLFRILVEDVVVDYLGIGKIFFFGFFLVIKRIARFVPDIRITAARLVRNRLDTICF